MDKQTRMIAGIRFEKTVNGYIYKFSHRHYIVVTREQRGWTAYERRIRGTGSFVDGTKKLDTINEAYGENLDEAVVALLESM